MKPKMPSVEQSHPLFGPFAITVGPVVDQIIDRSQSDRHAFFDFGKVDEALEGGELSQVDYGRLQVLDYLQGCHLGSLLILLRTRKWVVASYQSYEAEDLLSWANNTRALIESTSDFFSDFYNLSVSTAKERRTLQSFLNGRDDKGLNLTELQEPLAHFFHGRKLTKSEKIELPKFHEAKQTWEYVKDLERHHMPGLYALYSELSEISHPSKHSLWKLTTLEESGEWRLNGEGEARSITEIISRYPDIFDRLLYYSFLPSLVMLRVLVKFKLFTKHPELRKFDFSAYPQWNEIEKLLRT